MLTLKNSKFQLKPKISTSKPFLWEIHALLDCTIILKWFNRMVWTFQVVSWVPSCEPKSAVLTNLTRARPSIPAIPAIPATAVWEKRRRQRRRRRRRRRPLSFTTNCTAAKTSRVCIRTAAVTWPTERLPDRPVPIPDPDTLRTMSAKHR